MAIDLETRPTVRAAPPERPVPKTRRQIARPVLLGVLFVLMTVPVYLLLVNSFKDQEDILNGPFALPFGNLTLEHLNAAIHSPQFNVIRGYGFTLFLVVTVDVLCILLAGPAAYVIARSMKRRTQLLMLYFLAGTFIPGAALIIPVIYVLRSLGLANTVTGLIAHDVASTLPVSIFLFVGFIRTIPVDIDHAAQIDGAGRYRTFWTIIFPLMRPGVVTVLILNSIGDLERLRQSADPAQSGLGAVHRDHRDLRRDQSVLDRPDEGVPEPAAGDRAGDHLLHLHAAAHHQRPDGRCGEGLRRSSAPEDPPGH